MDVDYMKFKNSSFWMLAAVLSGLMLIILIISYLGDSSRLYNVPGIFLFLFIIISVIFFDYRGYYNKNLYQFIGVAFLILMWIILYIMISQGENTQFFVIAGLITILFSWFLYSHPKEWEKVQKELENTN